MHGNRFSPRTLKNVVTYSESKPAESTRRARNVISHRRIVPWIRPPGNGTSRAHTNVPGPRRRHRRLEAEVLIGSLAVPLRSMKTGILAATAMMCLAGCSNGTSDQVRLSSPDTTEKSESDSATTPANENGINDSFSVIGTGTSPTSMLGAIAAAGNLDEYAQLIAAIDFAEPIPAPDFEQFIVVAMTVPDGLCDRPQTVVRFELSEATTLTPIFDQSLRSCRLALRPRTILTSINRAVLSAPITVRLPANETYGYAESRLEIDPSQ